MDEFSGLFQKNEFLLSLYRKLGMFTFFYQKCHFTENFMLFYHFWLRYHFLIFSFTYFKSEVNQEKSALS